jgi:hypothetical protein
MRILRIAACLHSVGIGAAMRGVGVLGGSVKSKTRLSCQRLVHSHLDTGRRIERACETLP